MAFDIGSVDNAGSEGLAHWQMLLKIKTFAEANGWTTLRYTNPTDGSNRELILKGVGYSGTEEIFIGFRTYHNVGADFYNIGVAVFTGYVSVNAFTAQPGYYETGVCAHNQIIYYWLSVSPQRIMLGMKVGTPVYEIGYAGKFFPYASPQQYPYPVVCIGTLAGALSVRYSDTSFNHSCGVIGFIQNNVQYSSPCGAFRDLNGVWNNYRCPAWTGEEYNLNIRRRDTGGYYTAIKAVLTTGGVSNYGNGTGNVWGELEGIRYISGFNNAVENYLQEGGTPVTPDPSWTAAQAAAAIVAAGGTPHFILQNVFRTGISDYFLLEMK